MKAYFSLLLFALLFLSSCMKGESVDLIIHNARIHTMVDGDDKVHEAIAIRNGKIVEIGPERQILNKYSADEYIDAEKKDVYPGWTDAHGHMMNYARSRISVDLIGCQSFDEMILRIEKYQSKYKRPFIIGRGWDQSLWGDEMPTNEKLNELFPDIPVCLFRIDGHALLANDYLISKANLIENYTEDSELHDGGHYESADGPITLSFLANNDSEIDLFRLMPPTGVFVDNAMNPILEVLPDFPQKELAESLMEVQNELLMYGITGVHEAGLNDKDFKLFRRMVDKRKLKLNIYAMLLTTPENVKFAKKHGYYRNNNLYVRSFKVYGDGALGSRGAFLKHPYADRHDHSGYMVTSRERMQEIFDLCQLTGYQMNTHAIGDSTNRIILEMYEKVFVYNPDHRWRIEHAQIVDPADFNLFSASGAIPSVQPTHATSDQRWAEARLGEHRMEGAYAFNSLLEQSGVLAIGTDFPVEYIDPFKTIHAAVERKNGENFPSEGFRAEEAITLEECILGMTRWAAFASFQEDKIGTLEKGKDATISMFQNPVVSKSTFNANFAELVLIKGKKVYSAE
ncbi:MAG: amidohydrolase [bacterium]|nr:amidohydrolase [bacterium]